MNKMNETIWFSLVWFGSARHGSVRSLFFCRFEGNKNRTNREQQASRIFFLYGYRFDKRERERDTCMHASCRCGLN